jgi:hypothetical protein
VSKGWLGVRIYRTGDHLLVCRSYALLAGIAVFPATVPFVVLRLIDGSFDPGDAIFGILWCLMVIAMANRALRPVLSADDERLTLRGFAMNGGTTRWADVTDIVVSGRFVPHLYVHCRDGRSLVVATGEVSFGGLDPSADLERVRRAALSFAEGRGGPGAV